MQKARYYFDHEKAYQGVKARGGPGWVTNKEFRDPESEAAILPFILKYVGKGHGLTALDLGCGSGPTAHMLFELGFEVTGIDVSPTAVEMAQKRAADERRSIEFVCGDILDLARQNRRFDLIYDSHCLHCIVLDDDRARTFAAIRDSLSENGHFILDTMAYRETADVVVRPEPLRFDENYVLWHKTKADYEGVEQLDGISWCPQRRVYPVQTILTELEKAGMKVIHHEAGDDGPAMPYSLRAVCGKL